MYVYIVYSIYRLYIVYCIVYCAEEDKSGILMDEAYEMFHSPSVSAIEFIKDLHNSNVFLTGACTKGLLDGRSWKPFSISY